mmetsp:Transcript_20911/g.33730  ORF Transcript_20911/g.33730 Transcript_20911/m.33730 type:complete len:311 (-) Transcript_20911:172-1104(-)
MVAATSAAASSAECYGSPSLSATSSEGSRTPPASPQPTCMSRNSRQSGQTKGSQTTKGTKRGRGANQQSNGNSEPLDHKQLRMLERKRRNRESAERSRQRRIQYYKQLETDVTGLRAENTALRNEVEQLRNGGGSTTAVEAAEMAEMRAQNAALQAQVERLQAELAAQLQPRKRAKTVASAPAQPPAINTQQHLQQRSSAAQQHQAKLAPVDTSFGADLDLTGLNMAANNSFSLISPLNLKQESLDLQPDQEDSHGDDLKVLLEDVLSMEMCGANLFPSDPTYKELELSSLENDEAVDMELKLESAVGAL